MIELLNAALTYPYLSLSYSGVVVVCLSLCPPGPDILIEISASWKAVLVLKVSVLGRLIILLFKSLIFTVIFIRRSHIFLTISCHVSRLLIQTFFAQTKIIK